MSLSQSLQNAVSGLTASSRSAETIAANLANLRTPGYGRRDLALAALTPHGGVEVVAVTRHENPVLLADRRVAGAEMGGADVSLNFYKKLEATLGQIGQSDGLTASLANLEAAFAAATQHPASEAHLADIIDAAGSLADRLGRASQTVQSARQEADRNIDSDVKSLNEALIQVYSVNRDVLRLSTMGQDISGLLDQRQVLIDRISEIIPVREVKKDGNVVALYTMGGTALLDGLPATLSFTPAGTIAPESGALSGLTLNGRSLNTAQGGDLGTGRLSANFALRDTQGPEAQATLDAVARDLMMRLEKADSTLASGAAGLLTDRGAAFNSTAELGLAGRLSLNAAVDPAQGGQLWRLRSGIGAASPSPVADASMIESYASALRSLEPTQSGNFLPNSRSFAGLIGELQSRIATNRLNSESSHSFASSRHSVLTQAEAQEGVDSDFELQKLLVVEKAYAANARVITTIDQMLDHLLRI